MVFAKQFLHSQKHDVKMFLAQQLFNSGYQNLSDKDVHGDDNSEIRWGEFVWETFLMDGFKFFPASEVNLQVKK